LWGVTSAVRRPGTVWYHLPRASPAGCELKGVDVELLRPCRTALALAAVVVSVVGAACGLSSTTPTTFAPFSKTDLVVGDGAEAGANSTIAVNYTGWLYDVSKPETKGPQFGTSAGSTGLAITLGAGQVIAGWEQGIPGMKVGGTRRLIVPPSLAYGGTRNGPLPPNATLVFEIELLDVSQ
jgi:FKBP-type peptidyl-prolyl cis-trans isomerase FkpA